VKYFVCFVVFSKLQPMAGKTITMSNLKQIIRLRRNGVSLQRISKDVGVSRNTVKKLKLIEVKGLDYDEWLRLPDRQLTLLLSDPDQILAGTS